jgi:hypothetical protein
MNRQKAWIWPFCAALILCLSILPARSWGQDDNDSWNQETDPPSRVARMNLAQGSVSFQPGGEGDWVDAVPNRPLTTGDNLWTDRDSRAELQVGSSSIRLSSETSLTFLELDDRVMQLRLAQGSVLLRVHHLDDDDTVEIDTPNLAFTVQRAGEYRVDVHPDGQTTLVDVYQGRGEAIGGGNNYTVVANQQASFSGDADQGLNYDVEALPWADNFTNWAFDRDRREDRSQSANYVSPEMTGYEDLDDNGSWSYAGNYGPVWYPTVSAGWAPYRFGHWVWVAPWGWTWVDDASWGFAPFHYGRWVVVGARWAWVPGPVAVRPVYAPALVAFVGGGGGFHFSASLGGGAGVAWFPLGPGEVFVPAYHVSRTYVNQVNVSNTVVNVTKVTNVYNTYTTTNINNTTVNRITYVNQTNVTAVSRDTFVSARPVAGNVVAVKPQEIAQAPISHMSGAEPVHVSVMGAGKPAAVAPPKAVVARQVVAQHAPVAPPVPFAQRQDKLVARPATPVNQPASQPANVRMQPGSQPANARQQPGSQPTNARPEQPMNRPEPAMNKSEPAPTRPEPPVSRPEPTVAKPEPAVKPERPINREDTTPAQRPAQQAPKPEWQAQRPGGQAQSEPARPAATPSQPTRPTEPYNNGPARPQPSPQPQPEQGWSHPQAKPAPPVQPKSENQARDEENKYRNWQQQAKPEPSARPQPPAKQPEKQPPPKDKDKDKKPPQR